MVATATRLGTTVDGLTSDKEAEMSVVMLQAADGRRALLAFTGLDSLQTWRVDARPVPVTLDRAAQTARSEGVGAVLIDVAGPHPLAIDGDVLDALAAGRRLVEAEGGEFAWIVPVSDVENPGAVETSPRPGDHRLRSAGSRAPVVSWAPTDSASCAESASGDPISHPYDIELIVVG